MRRGWERVLGSLIADLFLGVMAYAAISFAGGPAWGCLSTAAIVFYIGRAIESTRP